MKRRLAILIFCFAAAGLTIAAVYPKFKRVEKRGPEVGEVSVILPVPVDTGVLAIRNVLNNWADFDRSNRSGGYQNQFPSNDKWNHLFLFSKSNLVFPTDQEILLDRGADSFVVRYVAIPSERRTRDFYLYEPTGDFYWASEYFYKGQPAKFRCGFLIHLESAGDAATKLEVFEYQPTIWVGKYLGMSAHSIGPALLYDIRPVQATTSDRQELLRMIKERSAPQIELGAR